MIRALLILQEWNIKVDMLYLHSVLHQTTILITYHHKEKETLKVIYHPLYGMNNYVLI